MSWEREGGRQELTWSLRQHALSLAHVVVRSDGLGASSALCRMPRPSQSGDSGAWSSLGFVYIVSRVVRRTSNG